MFESGMDIVRADFHLHTRKDKEFEYDGEPNSFVTEYVKELDDQDIRVAVITNHNKFDFDEYKAIRKKANKQGIFVLPGIELSVKEGSNGVHTLIVFDPDTWLEKGTDHIASFLSGAFAGITNFENENTKCKYDLSTVIEKLDSYGRDYFIIFAHIEQKSGILSECAGGLLKSLVAQIPNFRDRVLGLQKLRTQNKIASLKQWLGYLPAFVEGSDPKKISDIGKGRQGYIKIGAYTYSAVKFALQDAANRVYSSITPSQHGYIESITFTGGKLNGQVLNFSPALNTLIGIRGSGKSSVLETLRYAFNINPQMDAEYKNGVVKNIMSSGGVIQVSVVDKSGHRYLVRRIYGDHPSVIDEKGNDLRISPQALLGKLLYFGQKDLSSSADHEGDLLNRIVGTAVPDSANELSMLLKEMDNTIKVLLDAEELSSQIAEVTTQTEETKHKIKLFEEKGVTVKLKKQLGFNADAQQLEQLQTRLTNFVDKLKKAAEYKYEEMDFQEYTSEYNSPQIENAKKQLQIFLERLAELQAKCDELSTSIGEIKSIHKGIQDVIDGLQEEFAAIKREISDDTLDPDICVKLNDTLSRLETRQSELNASSKSKQATIKQFRTFVQKRDELLRVAFKALERETEKINASKSNLQIKVKFKGDGSAFKELLKSKFRGTSIADSKYQAISESFTDFVDIIADWLLDDGKELKKILTLGEYMKATDKLKSLYHELILLETKDKVDILYHDKLLRQHSLGQRASALILFILTHNDTEVLIIDQPEDDLDNKVIYDEVLKVIRDMKGNMQFIFATHNANIPVLGDADMILAADCNGESITYQSGNIDTLESQQQIITIMEGGPEAFSRRKLIYSSWSKEVSY